MLKARFEKVVSLYLQRKGYEEFLPLHRPRGSGVGRSKETKLPLFPGYVFSKFSAAECFPILAIPGVNAHTGWPTYRSLRPAPTTGRVEVELVARAERAKPRQNNFAQLLAMLIETIGGQIRNQREGRKG
jgi:hypothetical protein